MAKKTEDQQNLITELTVEKNEFKQVLNERILIGEKIHSYPIQTSNDMEKMKSEFSVWTDYNSEYLKQAFNNPNNEYRKTYEDAGYFYFGLLGSNKDPIQEKKAIISAKVETLKKLVAKTELLKSSIPTLSHATSKPTFAMNEVFIVHGHDEAAKIKTARFIEKLGFKPIILHEQASASKTVIEKIETYSDVGFGIVLYTPCDIGAKNEDNPKLKTRARQNVVFEHGFLIGKIGRGNVCALVKGEIETPNDISGVVYIKMDDEDAWHLKLAKELRNAGYDVNMNKL